MKTNTVDEIRKEYQELRAAAVKAAAAGKEAREAWEAKVKADEKDVRRNEL